MGSLLSPIKLLGALAACILAGGPAALEAACVAPSAPPLLNELSVRAATGAPDFVELATEPDQDLSCYKLVGWKGEQAGADCVPYNEVTLSGSASGLGYYTVAEDDSLGAVELVNTKVDYQIGPDAVALVFVADDGAETVVDAVVYGDAAEVALCDAGAWIGEGTPLPGTDEVLIRCPAGQDGDGAADFALSGEPTPGYANPCPAPKPDCDGAAAVIVNEVLYDTSISAEGGEGGEFIEIKGPAGTDLYHCYRLELVNGSDCEPYRTIMLDGVIGGHGYFAVASTSDVADADQFLHEPGAIQNGPDGVRLVYLHDDDGPQTLDAVFYGVDESGCTAGEGTPAPETDADQSLARCPDGADSDDNGEDFALSEEPTASGANVCPAPCPAAPEAIVINEFLVAAGEDGAIPEFIELKAPGGLDLRCYDLLAINGSDCSVAKSVSLTGAVSGDGYYVVGTSPELANVDQVSAAADLPDSNDGVELVFDSGREGEAPVVVDSVLFGSAEALAECDRGEGAPALQPTKPNDIGKSIGRVPDGADTDSNKDDFRELEAPTPGFTNEAAVPGPASCVSPEAVVINELLLASSDADDAAGEFIELHGPAGVTLSPCYLLRWVEDEGCRTGDIPLEGAIPEDGLFVVGTEKGDETADYLDGDADLATDTHGLKLVYRHADGELVIDAVYWDSDVDDCFAWEGEPVSDPDKGASIARTPDGGDTDDNIYDFVPCEVPTPGAPTSCEKRCTEAPAAVRLSELLVTPRADGEVAFVEIVGPPGLDLGCYQIEGVKGGTCDVYNEIALDGAIPDDGFFVVAEEEHEDADQVDKDAKYQTGPDAVRLVYRSHTGEAIELDVLVYKGSGANEVMGCEGIDESDPAPTPGGGTSLAADEDGAFVACSTPSPGAANDCGGGVTPPPSKPKGSSCALASGSTPAALALLVLGLLAVATRRARVASHTR